MRGFTCQGRASGQRLPLSVLYAAPGASAKKVRFSVDVDGLRPRAARRLLLVAGRLCCRRPARRGTALNDEGAAALAWSRALSPIPRSSPASRATTTFCLAVSNTRTSVATFISKVYRSTDHGTSWSDGVALPGEAGKQKTRSALAIACDPSADACYAVGPGGGVWRSTDQGRKWEPLDLPSTPEAYDRVACPAKETCVAVGGADLGHSVLIEGKKVTVVQLPKRAGGMLGLACDTATRCTATDTLGHYMSLSIPQKEWGPASCFRSRGASPRRCPRWRARSRTCASASRRESLRCCGPPLCLTATGRRVRSTRPTFRPSPVLRPPVSPLASAPAGLRAWTSATTGRASTR